ncbi:hypothetical protein VNO78_00450 [Psophocarpus tetragonolobus]|uniref:Uncharacterized protein n=1 Tax=Psophocarpus tetragonolobus TaxID=3891 RepID=A0AAN9XTT1_PSOTE
MVKIERPPLLIFHNEPNVIVATTNFVESLAEVSNLGGRATNVTIRGCEVVGSIAFHLAKDGEGVRGHSFPKLSTHTQFEHVNQLGGEGEVMEAKDGTTEVTTELEH